MYNTKLKLILLLVISVFILLFSIFATLIYIECGGTGNFFHISDADKPALRVVAIIFFAIAAGLFMCAICIFIFFILQTLHNNQTVELVQKLKIKFADSKNASLEQVESALVDLRNEIKEAKKNGIELKRPIQENQPTQTTINVTNNYNNIPNNNIYKTTTTTTTTTTRPLPPPPVGTLGQGPMVNNNTQMVPRPPIPPMPPRPPMNPQSIKN